MTAKYKTIGAQKIMKMKSTKQVEVRHVITTQIMKMVIKRTISSIWTMMSPWPANCLTEKPVSEQLWSQSRAFIPQPAKHAFPHN